MKYKDRLVFGQITNPSQEFLSKYQINKNLLEKKGHILIVFKTRDGAQWEQYRGDMRHESVAKFINDQSVNFAKDAVKYQLLTKDKHEAGLLCGKTSSDICVIYFGKPTKEMDQLVGTFQDMPVNFAYIPPEEAGFKMKQSHFEGASLIFYKAKLNRWQPIESLSQALIEETLLQGTQNFKKSKPLVFTHNFDEL
jgi:hypothetical protein